MDPAPVKAKDDRLQERWDRICAKKNKEAGNPLVGQTEKITDSEHIHPETKQQVRVSRNLIDDTKNQGLEKVTDIATEHYKLENSRRMNSENQESERVAMISRELSESEVLNKKIEQKWFALSQKSVPQEIESGIRMQKKTCSKVSASKNELIEQFSEAFKVKSEEYVATLKKQEGDITQLIWRMHKEYNMMKDQYQKQMIAIEEAFLMERRAIVASNKTETDELFERRRRLEVNMIENQNQRDAQFQSDLDHVRLLDDEKYNQMKVDMENNIALLEQQLEEMRATYQLNHEKLQYNYQVLQEREKENKDTVAFQKRKLKRLKEAVAALKTKYEKSDAKFKSENSELGDEYRRTTKQYKELQKKYRHFEKVDTQKYREIWEMKEEDAMKIVEEVLQADKIVHEQVLGLQWTPPELLAGRSIRFDVTQAPGENTMASTIGLGRSSAPSATGFLQKPTLASMPSVSSEGSLQSPHSNGPDRLTNLKMSTITQRFSDEAVKKVIDLLVQESTFILDKEEDIEDPELKNIRKIDQVLGALGIEDQDDLEEVVGHFYSEGTDKNAEELLVHPNDFTKEIRIYVESRQASNVVPATTARITTKPDGTQEKRERKRNRDRDFWDRLANAISADRFRVWSVLGNSLERYVGILEERSNLVDETATLQEQNQELKNLLKQYLSSDINQELVVPPTQVMDVQLQI